MDQQTPQPPNTAWLEVLVTGIILAGLLFFLFTGPVAGQLASDTIRVEVVGYPYQLEIQDDCENLTGYVGQQRTCTVQGQDFDGNPVPSQVTATSENPQVVAVDSVVATDATATTYVVHLTLLAVGDVALVFDLDELTTLQGYMTDPNDPTSFRWSEVDPMTGVRTVRLDPGQDVLLCWIWFSGGYPVGKTDARCPLDVPLLPEPSEGAIQQLRQGRLG